MKKFLSALICILLICSSCAFAVSAGTNYCSLFEEKINTLHSALMLSNSSGAEEGKSFDTAVIMEYVKLEIGNDYIIPGKDFYEIPANIFEDKAKKCFAIVNVNDLRSYEEEYWDESAGGTARRLCYDSEKNAYVFSLEGGFGGSTIYVIKGYVVNGNKYTAYSNFIDLAENVSGEVPEGNDYVIYDGIKYKVLHSIKNVVETDGTDVKFHSWQKISAIPQIDGLITPDTVIDDNGNTSSSTPSTSTPSTSTPSTSTPSEGASSGGSSNGGTTSGGTSSNGTTSSRPTVSSNSQGSSSPEQPSSPSEEKPLVTVAQTDGVKLEAEENVFPENTSVTIDKITEGENFETAKTALTDISQKFTAYEISAKRGDSRVQPNGKAKATFSIPEDYDPDMVAVFYISEDGSAEQLISSTDKSLNTITAELSHFSIYAVAETNTVQTDDDENDSDRTAYPMPGKDNRALIFFIIGILAVIVIGGALCCVLIYKKKRSASNSDTDKTK